MSSSELLQLLAIIVNLCQNEVPHSACIAKYENCIRLNKHTEALIQTIRGIK